MDKVERYLSSIMFRIWSPHNLEIQVFVCLIERIHSARAILLSKFVIKLKRINPFGKKNILYP